MTPRFKAYTFAAVFSVVGWVAAIQVSINLLNAGSSWVNPILTASISPDNAYAARKDRAIHSDASNLFGGGSIGLGFSVAKLVLLKVALQADRFYQ